ncbi:putative spermidine/putrescine transport system permease protein [Trueperella bonasi]|uniref:Spermidine/putrescine transport system permease protein n=1 Tax=Trueperella bonasi TaxID=312286 RepID=A0ABT9NEX5_9ACTO|nr:ABC transporter permease subunit [Trueperella bonasi]MDP9805946.1 putative spermidine/putrescine transport system permease protein [Trueperella bonasi]
MTDILMAAPSAPAKPERKKKRGLGWLLAVPAALVTAVFGLYPLFVLIYTSFGLGELGPYESESFEARGPLNGYIRALVINDSVREAIKNSLIVAGGAVVITVALAIPLVLYLARQARAGKQTGGIDVLMTFPIVLPGIIIGFFMIVLFGRNGLLVGAIPGTRGLAFTMVGLMIAYVYFSIPRVVGPLRGAAEMLDPDLQDTAYSLGASRTRVFFTVTLPLILPAAIEVAGTAAAVALGGYGTVAALSEGVRLLPLDVVDTLNNGYHIATASAYAVILALLTVLCLAVGNVLSKLVRRAFA